MAGTVTRPSTRSSARLVAPSAPTAPATPSTPSGRPTALVGAALAVWTVALGLAVLVCLALAAWVTASHHDDSVKPALATAVRAWLLAQHAGIAVAGGSISVAPLGLTVALGAVLVRAGRLTARHSGAKDVVDAAMAALALALPYAVVAALLTAPAREGDIQPSPLEALVGAFVLASACAGLGAFRETGSLAALVSRIRPDVRAVLRAGFSSSAVIVGAGALLLALGMITHAGRASNLVTSLGGGLSSVVLMSVISMAYVPNAVLWASAYATGAGFAVGQGTSVSLAGAHVGAVPSLPLLAPMPDAGPAPVLAWLLLAAPIAAGVLAGWSLARGRAVEKPSSDDGWVARFRVVDAGRGLAAGGVAAIALGVAAALSGGSLGGGRMSVLGPSAWHVGLAVLLEVGVSAAAAAWLLGWWQLRRQGE